MFLFLVLAGFICLFAAICLLISASNDIEKVVTTYQIKQLDREVQQSKKGDNDE